MICVSQGASQSGGAGKANPRPARDVIDDAIRENRYWEWLCGVLVVTFVVVGVGVIVHGAWVQNSGVSIAGSIAAALFWPALQNAVAIRRANIAIRLLEVPLGHAKTTQQAADAIREAFLTNYPKGKSDVAS